MKKLLAVGAAVIASLTVLPAAPVGAAAYCARPATGPSIDAGARSARATFQWFCLGQAATRAACYSRVYGVTLWRTGRWVSNGSYTSVVSCQISGRDEVVVNTSYVTR